MPIPSIMNPATINTILNTAPVILQGANKLVRLIRERQVQADESGQQGPSSLEDLQAELQQITQRLDANDESDVEQVQLIEQLARQNEALAESLRRMFRHILLLSACALVAVCASLIAVFMAVGY